MLLVFTYALTILSFIIPKNIVLRGFSATTLVAVALAGVGESFFYVGFGSINVINYFSAAGDPGRGAEPWICLMYGLFGMVQLIYMFYLIVRWNSAYVTSKRSVDEIAEEVVL